ncbi:MAG: NAD(P)H-dependent oxidoreductase subunit E [Candidatus Rokubacteria bacterium]|nr:NAD(P)H-dependent oxidoreductase subunit E [Candidatus Rokubacteria bacterium]
MPLDQLLAPFARERTWLLPALQAVQADRGWLSLDDLAAVSDHLRVPKSEVYGVATHYPELRLTSRGVHLVRVCTGVSCRVSGGVDLLNALGRRFGVSPGETTPDGEVTLEEADCCFVCSVAPVVEVDHQYLTAPRVDAVIEACRRTPRHPTLSPPAKAGREAPERGEGAEARLAHLVAEARARRRPALRLLVGAGSCGQARGAGATRDALREALTRAGLDAEVGEGACNGLCYAAPVVEILRGDAPRLTVERVTPDRVPALVRLLQGAADHGLSGAAWAERPVAGLPPAATHPVLGGQQRLLSARWGAIASADLADALLAGSYATLARILDRGDPTAVIAAVKAAGLLGRGGAYFPAAVKWEGCRAAKGTPKYIVVNGEEGEPGIFKDRHVMEADPHRLLEGVLLAAYATAASRGIFYIHGEANLAAERCAAAVVQARAWGLLGPRVLGTEFAFDVEIRRGAGGFILGEETALLESIEGRRAMPRPKPPFPVEVGVYGQPTVINNVETLAAVPLIVGGEPQAAATKLYGLSGHVARPAVVEVAPPVTLRRLLVDLGGGVPTGRPLGAIVIGGPSGVVVPPAMLDVPLERPTLSPGTGGVVALDDSVSVLEVVRALMAFNAKESCGKCTPCREGTARMLGALDRLAAGTAGEADLGLLRDLADVVQIASLCGLGQAAPLSLKAAFEHFPGAFLLPRGVK